MSWNANLMPVSACESVLDVKLLSSVDSLLSGRKRPYMDIDAVDGAISNPSPESFPHPRNRSLGVMPLSHVSPVYRLAHFSQIAQAIIQRLSVYVIDFTIRPTPIGNRKNDPMGLKNYTVNLAFSISGVRNRKSLFASIRRMKSAIANILPKKAASLFVIAKEFTANFRCDIGSISHSAVPLRSGQGRRLFAQLFRPVSYASFILRSQGDLA
jgi:hypothetical protein